MIFRGDHYIRIDQYGEIEQTIEVLKRGSPIEGCRVSFPIPFDYEVTNDKEPQLWCHLGGFKHVPSVAIPCKHRQEDLTFIVLYPGMEVRRLCDECVDALECWQDEILHVVNNLFNLCICMDDMIDEYPLKNYFELTMDDWAMAVRKSVPNRVENIEHAKMQIEGSLHVELPLPPIVKVLKLSQGAGKKYLFNPTLSHLPMLDKKYVCGVMSSKKVLGDDLLAHCNEKNLEVKFGSGAKYV